LLRWLWSYPHTPKIHYSVQKESSPGPYSESVKSSSHNHTLFLWINWPAHACWGHPSCLPSSIFLNKMQHAFLFSLVTLTYPIHFICEVYKFWSFFISCRYFLSLISRYLPPHCLLKRSQCSSLKATGIVIILKIN